MKLESNQVQCFFRKLLKAAVSSHPPYLEKSIFSVFRKGDGRPTSEVKRGKEYGFNQVF